MALAKRLMMVAISCIYVVVRTIWDAVKRLIRRGTDTNRLVVLTYHAVCGRTAHRFERQMRYLYDRADAVFADAPVRNNGRPCVAVTFDDAFQNVFDLALPVMTHLRLPSTIFVPTGYLGGEPAWISPAVRRQLPADHVVSVSTLFEADSELVRFGSHTVSHSRLADLDPVSLDDELNKSKAALENITGNRVTMLSLPYGSYTSEVIAAARRAGYERVFANVPVRSANPPLTGRVNVSPRDWMCEFRLKVHGAYLWMIWAVPAKRRLMKALGTGLQ